MDSPQSLAIWKKMVTKRRGEYSARLKSARLTSGNGCLSWPTTTGMDGMGGGYARTTELKDGVFRSQHSSDKTTPWYGNLLRDAVEVSRNWPSATVSDVHTGNLKSTQQKEGSMHSVTLAQAAEKMWPTSSSRDYKDTPGMSTARGTDEMGRVDQLPRAVHQAEKGQWMPPRACEAENPPMGDRNHQGLTHQVVKGGQVKSGHPAPDNPNSPGSRRESLWASPRSAGSAGSKNVVYEPGKKPTVDGRPITTTLTDQVKESWATPQTEDHCGTFRNNDSTLRRDCLENPPAKIIDPDHSGNKNAKLNPLWVCTLMGVPVKWVRP